MRNPYTKFQDSSFNGLKVTVGTKNVKQPRTHTPKAICPINFFKVGCIINKQKPNMVVWAVCGPNIRRHIHLWTFLSLPLIQKEQAVKEWVLNTGKLPPKCLLRKRVLRQTVVKYMTIWTVSQLFQNKNQNSLLVIHIIDNFFTRSCNW